MLNLFLTLFLSIGTVMDTANAQQFEGSISFARYSMVDTMFYTYHIKGQKVRVEELDSRKNIKKYAIIDLAENKMQDVNPSRKIYMPVSVRPYTYPNMDGFETKKTGNFKYLYGYKCEQYQVINKDKNTVITYWVTEKGFTFFNDIIKIIDRTDKNSLYYLQIPEIDGLFPMLTVERSLLREFRMQLEVISIEEKSLSTDLFAIPEDFHLFQY